MEETQKESSKKSITIPEIKISSDVLKWIIVGSLVFVVILLMLGIGMRIGTEKARFSCNWAKNYQKNFGGPKAGFMDNWRGFPGPDFIEGHGSIGEIIKINEGDFVIKDRGNTEKIILVDENTVINKSRDTIKLDELKTGDFTIIIGAPNDLGQIDAKLIRVMPAQEPPIK